MAIFDVPLFDRVGRGLGSYPAIVELVAGLIVVHQPDGDHDAVLGEVAVALQQAQPGLVVVPRPEVFVETSVLRPDLVAVGRETLDRAAGGPGSSPEPTWFPEPLGFSIIDVVHIVEVVAPETSLIDTLAKLDLLEHGPASFTVVEMEGYHYSARTLYGVDPFDHEAPTHIPPSRKTGESGKVVQWRPRDVAEMDSADDPVV